MAISNYNLCLAASNYGVGIGKKATGTQASPKFEVAYPSFFDDDIIVTGDVNATEFAGDGSAITNVTAVAVNFSDGVSRIFRTGTAGAAGYVTFILPT